MSTSSPVPQSLDALLQQAIDLLTKPPYELSKAASLFTEVIAQRPHAPFTVVVLGPARTCQQWLNRLFEIERPAQPSIDVFHSGPESLLTLLDSKGNRQSMPWSPEVVLEDLPAEVTEAHLALNHPLLDGVEIVNLGGEEDEVKSTLRTRYISLAQAFIFVTNATQVFSQWEREQIAALLGGRAPYQAYFVVMDMHQIPEEDETELRDWVQRLLAPYFVDPNGGQDSKVDEAAYYRQVHFVNPRQEESVALVRTSLATFLGNKADRTRASEASTVQLLLCAVGDAEMKVARRQTMLQGEIERQRAEQRDHLKTSESAKRRQAEFGEQMQALLERCQFVVYESLLRQLGQMERRWRENATQIFEIDSFSPIRLATATFSSQAQEQMSMVLQQKVAEYLVKEFADWASQVSEIFATTVAEGHAALAERLSLPTETVQQVQLWLQQTPLRAVDRQIVEKALQQEARQWLGIGEGREELVRLAARVVLFAATAIGPLLVVRLSSLIVWAIFETMQAKHYQRSFKATLSAEMVTDLFRMLRAELPTQIKPKLDAGIKEQFSLASEEIIRAMQVETDNVQQQTEELGAKTQAILQDLETRMAEIEDARTELSSLVASMGRVVYDKPFTLDEVAALYSRKARLYAMDVD